MLSSIIVAGLGSILFAFLRSHHLRLLRPAHEACGVADDRDPTLSYQKQTQFLDSMDAVQTTLNPRSHPAALNIRHLTNNMLLVRLRAQHKRPGPQAKRGFRQGGWHEVANARVPKLRMTPEANYIHNHKHYNFVCWWHAHLECCETVPNKGYVQVVNTAVLFRPRISALL